MYTNYRLGILEEESLNESELLARRVGKIDPQAYIKENAEELSENGATQMIRLHLDRCSF